MALAESNQVVNSYLSGIQQQLQQNQLAKENALKQAESERQQQMLELNQKQFDESVKNTELARKAAQAQFRLNVGQHASEYAQNNEPDIDPNTGKPAVDANGIGSYTVSDINGNPLTFKAPTREQQANIAATNYQRQQDIAQAEAAKTESQAHINKMAEMGTTQANAIALENTRAKTQLQLRQMEDSAANYRDQLNRASMEKIARINSGLDDGMGGQSPFIQQEVNNVLGGNATDKDLAGFKPGVKNAIKAGITASGGITTQDKDIQSVKQLSRIASFLPKLKEAIANQKNTTSIPGSFLSGEFQNLTDPQAREIFGELQGFAPSIATGIGGEQGQRLTDFKQKMSNAGFIPSITNPKMENIRRFNNMVSTIRDTATSLLSNYPPKQRDLILSNLGLTAISPYSVINDEPKTPGQQTPDPSQFDKRK